MFELRVIDQHATGFKYALFALAMSTSVMLYSSYILFPTY